MNHSTKRLMLSKGPKPWALAHQITTRQIWAFSFFNLTFRFFFFHTPLFAKIPILNPWIFAQQQTIDFAQSPFHSSNCEPSTILAITSRASNGILISRKKKRIKLVRYNDLFNDYFYFLYLLRQFQATPLKQIINKKNYKKKLNLLSPKTEI